MSVYDRASNADGYGEMLIGRDARRDECATVTVVTRDATATIALSPQDARRMGEALIELANASGA